jgi:hypothetical protein
MKVLLACLCKIRQAWNLLEVDFYLNKISKLPQLIKLKEIH